MPSDPTITFDESIGSKHEVAIPRLGLVIVWSASESDRAGEVALLRHGEAMELGRELAGPNALVFARQRPGSTIERPPLLGPGISRKQLKLRARQGAITVEQLGRCALLVGGEETTRAVLTPGDVLTLRGQLMLLCVERPAVLPAAVDARWDDTHGFGRADALGLVGESPAIWELRDQLAFAAKTDAHTLVTGDSGTGKEVVARGIHALSKRARGRFIGRNASTMPAGLVDAELFGNVRNYPNPGTPERAGLIGEAQGGTLFLDELGELAPDLQAHLLRVLDGGGEYHRLGESSPRRADVRLIGATNRDPTELKHDLLPRLSVRVAVPSLIDRREDLPLLVQHLLERELERSPEAVERFRADDGSFRVEAAVIEDLLTSPLPGNVRDVLAYLWAAMRDSRSGAIRPPSARREAKPASAVSRSGAPANPAPRDTAPTEEEVRAVIRRCEGNLKKAARELGLPSRYGLYRLLKRFDIPLEEARGGASG